MTAATKRIATAARTRPTTAARTRPAGAARTRLATACALALAAVAAVLAAPAAAQAAAWESPQVVGSDGSKYPSLAVGPDGVVHAAWQGPTAIMYNAKPGATWQMPAGIAANPMPMRQFGPGPLIGADGQGVVTIAWREQAPDGSLTIKAARRAPNGLTTTETIGTSGFGGNSFALDVADNGAAAIVYFSGMTSNNGQMQVATRAPGDLEFGNPEVPGGPGQTYSYPFDAPSVDIADDGTVAAVYSPDAPTVAVRPAGGSWELEQNVGAPAAGVNANANVVVEPAGDVVLAYFEQDPGFNGPRRLAVRERPAGQNQSFGAVEHAANNLSGTLYADVLSPVAIARGGDGVTTIAFRQSVTSDLDSVIVARRPDGGPLGNADLLANGGTRLENVRVASDAAGSTIVSWRGFDPGQNPGVQPNENMGPVLASIRPAGGPGFGDATVLVGGQASATAAAIRNGRAVVGWTRNYSGCAQIEATVFTDSPGTGLPPLAPSCGAGGAANPPATPSPSAGGGATVDRAAPRIRISTRAQKFAKQRRIVLSFTCSESCSGVVNASVRHTPRKGKKKQRLVKLSIAKFRGEGGRRTSVRYKLSNGQVTAIKKMLTKKGKATFVASISTVDADGNRGRVTARIALKR